jgi:Protein of unknown function (DUF3300)
MPTVRTEVKHESQHCLPGRTSAVATHEERRGQRDCLRQTFLHISKRGFASVSLHAFRVFTAIICIATLVPGDAMAEQTQPSATQTNQTAVKLPPAQLDSLVAPIALYPDPLLTQTLVASTYPLEVIQLKQWMDQHKDLKDKALADAVEKEEWDPSIKSMAGLPDVVKLLADNIKWTTDLGNAFLAQQSDVMDAVQRMRKKASDGGNLKSSEQQKVETKVVENKQVIVIEQANPEVIYVPSYNPTVVYGAPVYPYYPYPPIYYPPVGYYAAGMAISFGIGVAMGAFWGGGWGYGCGWGGGNNVYINHNNNNFNGGNRNNIGNGNVGNGNRGNGNRPSTLPSQGGGRSNWQHNPQHRGGAPYGDRNTADRFGGNTRGASMANRQASARQNLNPRAGLQPAGGLSNRGAGPSAGTRDIGRGGAGGANSIGNRQVSQSPSATNRSAFGGASARSSGSQARASSSRGASSMGARGGRGGGGGRRR